VDDNADAADSMRRLLGATGHDVRVARDGHEALALVREWRPELLLLDIGLPGADGFQVADQIRRECQGDPPYIVAVTGYCRTAAEDERMELFDAHLVKPASLGQVQAVIEQLCERSCLHSGAT
jgi:CheY-like chemotaxis protein